MNNAMILYYNSFVLELRPNLRFLHQSLIFLSVKHKEAQTNKKQLVMLTRNDNKVELVHSYKATVFNLTVVLRSAMMINLGLGYIPLESHQH